MSAYRFRPEEVLVVRDNPDSEIKTGSRLGIAAVKLLLAGVPRAKNARSLTGVFGFSRAGATRLANNQMWVKNECSDRGNSLLDPFEQQLCRRLAELTRAVVYGR